MNTSKETYELKEDMQKSTTTNVFGIIATTIFFFFLGKSQMLNPGEDKHKRVHCSNHVVSFKKRRTGKYVNLI